MTVHWDPPDEASGIEGYLYDFNQKESHDPEILNLSSTTNSLKLLADTEGTTITAAYGASAPKAGSSGIAITVQEKTLPRPLEACHSQSHEPHSAHISRGTWRQALQRMQRWKCSAPCLQKP